jgi:flagellar assembly factor FliW
MENSKAVAPQPIQQKIIHFPNGLIGLENYRKFMLKELPDHNLFFLLQSLEDEHFGLVVTNPFWFISDYEFDLPEAYGEQMGDKTNLEVLVTVNVASNPENITTNLLGPIVFDPNVGIGFQVLASDKNYTARYKLMSAKPAGG